MSNVKIWGRNQLQAANVAEPVIVTSGSETVSMPVTNLQSMMPTEPWRSLNTNDTLAWCRIDLGGDWQPYDLAALLYTDVYPRKNLARFSRTFSGWTLTGLTGGTDIFTNDVPFGKSQAWVLSAPVTQHKLDLGFSIPAQVRSSNTWFQTFTLSTYVYAGFHEGSQNFRLRVTGDGSTVEGDFNSSLGDYTTGSSSSSGAGFLANPVLSIEQAGEDFWRLALTFDQRNLATAIDAEILILAGSTESYAGAGQVIYIDSPQLEHGPSMTSFDTDNDAGLASSLARVEIAQEDFGIEVVVDDGALEFFRRSDELALYGSERGFTHFAWDADFALSTLTTAKYGRYIEITFWSDGNVSPSEQLDVGLAYVGQSFQPAGNLEQGSLRVRFEERAEDIDTDDHTYREQNKRRRIYSFDLSTMTEDEAWQDAFNIQMVSGRSRPVLVDLNGGELGAYGQQRLIYGYLDDLGPVHHRYRKKYGHSYQIREVLP